MSEVYVGYLDSKPSALFSVYLKNRPVFENELYKERLLE